VLASFYYYLMEESQAISGCVLTDLLACILVTQTNKSMILEFQCLYWL